MSESEVIDPILERDEPAIESGAVTEDDLQRMLREARSQQEAAERRANEAERRAGEAETQRDRLSTQAVGDAEARYRAQETAIDSSIVAARAEADRAEADLARAMEAGDHASAAKAQRVIAAAEARADRLTTQKDYLVQNKERFTRPAPQAQARRSDDSPYAGWELVPGERDWLESRPKFLNDQSYQRRVIGASEMAVGEGHRRGSGEYFNRMEELLGEGGGKQSAAAPKRQSADIAPGRRAAPGAEAAGSGRQIRLTADQVEVADALYGDSSKDDYEPDHAKRYARYAANVQRMRDSGRLN